MLLPRVKNHRNNLDSVSHWLRLDTSAKALYPLPWKLSEWALNTWYEAGISCWLNENLAWYVVNSIYEWIHINICFKLVSCICSVIFCHSKKFIGWIIKNHFVRNSTYVYSNATLCFKSYRCHLGFYVIGEVWWYMIQGPHFRLHYKHPSIFMICCGVRCNKSQILMGVQCSIYHENNSMPVYR